MNTKILADFQICISVPLFIFVFQVVDAMLPFLDCFSCSVPITSGQLIPEHSTGCVDKSLQSNNILEQNLSAKCEHSLSFNFISCQENH